MAFKDHFSGHSQQYSKFRPHYPIELFSFLASLSPDTDIAWDCATGSGQAALKLSEFFSRVIATDASIQQVFNAIAREKIFYCAAAAEHAPFPNDSISLVTAAQALHWFRIDAFFREVQRVLKPGGIIAVWTYHLLQINHQIDEIVHYLYKDILDQYWPPERALVENSYADIVFPFEEISTPDFNMSTTWNLDDLIGYLTTWSATQRYIKARQNNPVTLIRDSLASAWGEPDTTRTVHWPLALRIGRKKVFQDTIVVP